MSTNMHTKSNRIDYGSLTPGNAFRKLWLLIPLVSKITFLSTFVVGFLVHGFLFSNLLLNNHDTLHFFTGAPNFIVSGRWLETFSYSLSGPVTMPWALGLLAIFYMSITACLIVACLGIKRIYCGILVGVILVAFPHTAVGFAYLGGVDGNNISILLACLSAYVSKKGRFGFIIGILFLTLALGINQISIAFTSGLFVIMLIFDLLQRELPLKTIIVRLVKYLSVLLIGIISYTVVLNILLTVRNITLWARQGIDQLGQTSVYQHLAGIPIAYREFVNYFYQRGFFPTDELNRLTFVILAVSIVLMLALLASKLFLPPSTDSEKSSLSGAPLVIRIVLLSLLLIAFPLAINPIHVLSPATFVGNMMLRSLLLFLVFVVALIDKIDLTLPQISPFFAKCGVATTWVSLAVLVLFQYNHFIVVNENYVKSELVMRHTYHFASTMVDSIRATPEFNDDMQVVLVGNRSGNDDHVMRWFNQGGRRVRDFFDTNQLINSFGFGSFVRIILGENITFRFIWGAEFFDEFRDELSDLNIYPSDGSKIIIDNILFIRMGYDF